MSFNGNYLDLRPPAIIKKSTKKLPKYHSRAAERQTHLFLHHPANPSIPIELWNKNIRCVVKLSLVTSHERRQQGGATGAHRKREVFVLTLP